MTSGVGQLESIRLNPKDGTIQYVMGQFYFSVAKLSWIERKVAAAVFGEPPKGTMKEALAYFLAAEDAEPDFYMSNKLWIAKTYLEMKNKGEAKQWIKRALAMPVRVGLRAHGRACPCDDSLRVSDDAGGERGRVQGSACVG